MNMGQVQVAIGMDWRLLDGMVRYLYRDGVIPAESTVQDGAIIVHKYAWPGQYSGSSRP